MNVFSTRVGGVDSVGLGGMGYISICGKILH